MSPCLDARGVYRTSSQCAPVRSSEGTSGSRGRLCGDCNGSKCHKFPPIFKSLRISIACFVRTCLIPKSSPGFGNIALLWEQNGEHWPTWRLPPPPSWIRKWVEIGVDLTVPPSRCGRCSGCVRESVCDDLGYRRERIVNIPMTRKLSRLGRWDSHSVVIQNEINALANITLVMAG